MRTLVRNTVINIASFGLVGAGGLLLVPVIVAHYGLEAYGLIVLARLLLPTGFLALAHRFTY